MSQRLLGVCVAVATLSLAEALSLWAGAKPPDLPVNTHEVCTPPDQGLPTAETTPAPSRAIGSGGNQENDDAILIRGEEASAHGKPLAAVTPCFSELIRGFWRSLTQTLSGTDTESVNTGEAEAIPLAPREMGPQSGTRAPASACPYLQNRQECRGAVTQHEPPVALAADTSADLQKLLAARRMFRIAERCRRNGDLDMAGNCYQETHLLAPASRYGRQAMERLTELEMHKTSADLSEEQEPSAVRPTQDEVRGPSHPDTRTAAARAMYRIAERCRQNGDFDMAYNCYHETQLLCPDSPCARQARERLCQIETERSTGEPVGLSEEQEAPVANPQKPPTLGPDGTLNPTPPVDPETVRALEQLLEEYSAAERTGETQLEVVNEETSPPPAARKEQEGVAGRRDTDPLFVPAPVRKMTIEEDATTPDGKQSSADFRNWLGQAAEAVGQASGVVLEIDCTSKQGWRAQSCLQLGASTYKVVCDETGCSFLMYHVEDNGQPFVPVRWHTRWHATGQ